MNNVIVLLTCCETIGFPLYIGLICSIVIMCIGLVAVKLTKYKAFHAITFSGLFVVLGFLCLGLIKGFDYKPDNRCVCNHIVIKPCNKCFKSDTCCYCVLTNNDTIHTQ